MTDRLRSSIDVLRDCVHDPLTEIPTLYDRAGHLAELTAALMSLTNRAAQATSSLPSAAEGLRIDGLGDLLSPDEVKTEAILELRAAYAQLDEAGRNLTEAVQNLSRLYIADGSIADQLRPSTD